LTPAYQQRKISENRWQKRRKLKKIAAALKRSIKGNA